MLDIKFIKENKEKVIKAIEDKQLVGTVDLEQLIELDDKRLDILRQVEQHRALRNQLSENISKLDDEARVKQIKEATEVKNELAAMETELKVLAKQIYELQILVPNVIADDVPVGKDENENVVIETVGKKPEFDFDPKDHVDLGEALDLIDVKTSAKVSGTRFNYLKNEAVLLQFALLSFVFDTLTDEKTMADLAKKAGNDNSKPFTPILPPVIIKGEVAKKMDRFDPIEDRYYMENDDAMFVGSAEHSLGPMYMDTAIPEEQLPIRYIGYSTAFRREAGTYGKDTRGILRCHQFDKLEMEIFSLPEHGLAEQTLIVEIQKHLVSQLELPYEVMMICTGDMGKPDARQIDINTWMPGQEKYRETHTSDYMTDYQARRLNTKFKRRNGETGYVHMNDATAFAIGRILIAIFENYQQKDGSIKIPEVLVKYMGGLEAIKQK